jgi:hypothetical protein
MYVVARISNQRHALRVAGDVANVIARQQPGRIVAVVQVGRPDRSTSVKALEVGRGGPVIVNRARICAADQRRAIGGSRCRGVP